MREPSSPTSSPDFFAVTVASLASNSSHKGCRLFQRGRRRPSQLGLRGRPPPLVACYKRRLPMHRVAAAVRVSIEKRAALAGVRARMAPKLCPRCLQPTLALLVHRQPQRRRFALEGRLESSEGCGSRRGVGGVVISARFRRQARRCPGRAGRLAGTLKVAAPGIRVLRLQ